MAGGLRVSGSLDVGVLEAAVAGVVARHEALRTRFAWADGALQQVVSEGDGLPVSVPVVVVEGLVEEWFEGVVEEPFDLSAGPLVRVVVGRLGEGEWAVGLVAHHTVVDGWSMGLILRELGALYGAHTAGIDPETVLPALDLQYGDFAVWQREELSGEALEEGLAYWKDTLAGASGLELPAERPRTDSASSYPAGQVPVVVPAALAGRLKTVAETGRATVFQGLLASFASVLGRWSGQSDVVVATPVAGRSRAELEDVVGFFVNTIALRLDTSGRGSFTDVLGRARETVLGALAHQDVPFEKVAQVAGSDLVRVLLALDNTPRGGWELPGAAVSEFQAGGGRAQFEVALHLRERGDGSLEGRLEYAADLFDADGMERLTGAWLRLLEAAVTHPDTVLNSHQLSSPAEQALIASFTSPDPEPVTGLMHEEISRQAAATPDALAVTDETGNTLTYRELDAAANRLANHLQTAGIGVEDVVGICLHRSLDLVVALVGVLKAGAAYLPLDPDYPTGRLTAMATGSRVPLVLTHDLALDVASALELPDGARLVNLDTDRTVIDQASDTAPQTGVGPENAAYVLYTSGSTGAPKGAVNTHAAFVNRIAWTQNAYQLDHTDRVLFKTPIGFDVSGWEWTWPLTVGATIQLVTPGGHRDPAHLTHLIRTTGTTVCHFVPSMLRYFLEHPDTPHTTTLTDVIVSGEELTPHLAHTFHTTLPHTRLHNLYGPTEAAIDVTAHTVDPHHTHTRIPIGTPITGTELHVLDTHHQPVPIGVTGHLHIGGTALARGYHHQSALTADRFTPHPTRPGHRLYATGDQARWTTHGTLEYLGRNDHQIKIRGQRIEPAEIDTALHTHPDITHTITTTHTTPDGTTHLATYYTTTPHTTPPTPQQLRTHLRTHLPTAMIPTYLTHLTHLPQLPNGKTNTKQLPPP
ncbi:amino acid adenylation domain-containing protein, partial [Streptomyces sp. NPDC056491]|uniref:non-ribosomal peptide synthetase n=1 Tax=Streptomyces sp. NPDC056491 TaxID=3345837 RepID=UPI0036C22134